MKVTLRMHAQAVDACTSGITIADALNPEYPIIYSNPAFSRLTGYGQDEVLGRSCLFLQGPETDPAAVEEIRRALAEQRGCEITIKNHRRDGSTFWNELFISPVRDPKGRVTHYVGLQIDVTGRKQLDLELAEAKMRAEAASQEKSSFLAAMSHDIRTSMNAIMGMTQLALETRLDPVQRKYLEHTDGAAGSLLGLLNDILDLSKIEAGKLAIDRLPFNLHQELKGLRSMLDVMARERGLELEIAVDPGVPLDLTGDALRLRQVMTNLIGNAIKFTPRGKVAVRISLLEKQDPRKRARLYFEIADSGIGMSEEQQARLFQPFSQADASISRRYGGTGLGLSICSRLVKMMGGEIGVKSEAGKGSTFRFSVWLGLAGQAVRRNSPEPVLAGRPICGLRVLLVDDIDLNREIARVMLENAGVSVSEAVNGQEALALLDNNPGGFDAVLMDLQMPVMDGIAATRRIRQHPQLGNLPIIALTAEAMMGDRQRCLDAGMNDYISKPFRADALYAALARTNGGQAAQTSR